MDIKYFDNAATTSLNENVLKKNVTIFKRKLCKCIINI